MLHKNMNINKMRGGGGIKLTVGLFIIFVAYEIINIFWFIFYRSLNSLFSKMLDINGKRQKIVHELLRISI